MKICGCVIHEVSVVLLPEEQIMHSIVSEKDLRVYHAGRQSVLSTEDNSCRSNEDQIKLYQMEICGGEG